MHNPNYDYRAEAAALARAETELLRALLVAFDMVDQSVRLTRSTLDEARKPIAEADHA